MTSPAPSSLSGLEAAGDLVLLEERWLEAFEKPPADPVALGSLLDDAARVLRGLARSPDHLKLLNGLVDVLPDEVEAGATPGPRVAFLMTLAETAPRTVGLRRRLRNAFKAAHASRPGIEALLDRAGIYKEDVPVAEVARSLDRLLEYEEGKLVRSSSWGTGQIKRTDRISGDLYIDFPGRKGHRMTPDAAVQALEILSPDDFDARGFLDPEGLKRTVQEEPLLALRLVVKSLGGKTTLDLVREKLKGTYVETDRWTGWWNRTKKLALQDPFLELGDGRPVRLTLREAAKSFLDEALEQIRAARTFRQRWEITRRYLKNADEGAEKIWEALDPDLARPLAKHESEDLPHVLEARLERGAGIETFLALPDLSRLLSDLSTPGAQEAFAKAIKAGRPDWAPVFAEAMFADGCRVRPWIRQVLLAESPAVLAEVDSHLVRDPTRDPEKFLLLADRVLSGRWVASSATDDPDELVIDLLLLLRSYERRETRKDYVQPAVKLLSKDEGARVARLIERAPLPRVARAGRLLHGCPSLAETVLVAVGPALSRRCPDLVLEGDVPFWEQAELLVTAASLIRRKQELADMMERQLGAAEKAIGEAAAFGDLSENAEWTAAIERRNQLVDRIQKMKHDVVVAVTLESQPLDLSRVSPGTKVRLQRTDREEPELERTILGPWDVDVPRGIVSYLSPLASGLLGHRTGEEVTCQLPEGPARYKILDVQRAV